MKTLITPPTTIPAGYLRLIETFPLRPIRSDDALAAAIAVMRNLTGPGRELTDVEDDYLEVLGDLIEKYEAEHFPIPNPSPADVLRYFLETKEVRPVDLARATEVPESTISAILAGRRGISKSNAVAFAKFFGVPPIRFLFD